MAEILENDAAVAFLAGDTGRRVFGVLVKPDASVDIDLILSQMKLDINGDLVARVVPPDDRLTSYRVRVYGESGSEGAGQDGDNEVEGEIRCGMSWKETQI